MYITPTTHCKFKIYIGKITNSFTEVLFKQSSFAKKIVLTEDQKQILYILIVPWI